MNLIILIVLFLVGVILYKRMSRKQLTLKYKKKHDNQHEYLKYMHLGHKSKCFDCESQFDYPYKYKGHSTRCFSCESDLDKRFGPEYAFYGQPNKSFDSEKQMNF